MNQKVGWIEIIYISKKIEIRFGIISGRWKVTMYHHDISVNYQLPLNKIPIINFLSLNTRYSANFDWTSAPTGSYRSWK